MITATPAQADLIRKLARSHVFSPEEVAAIDARLANGFTKGTPGKCIDWLQSEIKSRKAAEKEAAAAEQIALTCRQPNCARELSEAAMLYGDGDCDHCAIAAKAGRTA